MSKISYYGNLKGKVRVLLLKEWDPIGISDFPEAQDEYDAYIPEICRLMLEDNLDKFIEYMYTLEKYHIGLKPFTPKRHRDLYYKLLTLL